MSNIKPFQTRLVTLSIDAYDSICHGARAVIEAEPQLRDRPFMPELGPRPVNATGVEFWYRPELQGFLHALRLHGHIAAHPSTLQFEKANAHFAKALVGDYTNLPKFIESCVSVFYEVFVFNSIARTGITCEFVPSGNNAKSPDIALPKMKILIECKDIQGRSLSAWSIANLGRRIREQHAHAMTQFDEYDPGGSYERIVFVDLPDDNGPIARTLTARQILDLRCQILDAGESPGLDMARSKSLVLSATGLYHLVEPKEGRSPMVVPQILPPMMFPDSEMKAVLLDAIFIGERRPPWANWQPAMTARLQFEHFLPAEYKEAKAMGETVAYLKAHY